MKTTRRACRGRLLSVVGLSLLCSAVACDRDKGGAHEARASSSGAPSAAKTSGAKSSGGATSAAASGAEAADGGDVVPAGSPIIPLRTFDFAVYLAAPVSPALTADAAQKVKAAFPRVTLQKKPEPAPPPTAVVFAPDVESFGLPNGMELGLFEHGLTAAQTEAALQSKGALLFGWLLDADPKWADLRRAESLVADVATKASGFLWDDGTKELFTPAAWKKLRVDGWQGDLPDVRHHISKHYYRAEEQSRMVTLGLAELGLPDLVVDDVPVMESAATATLLDGLAQLLLEGASVGAGGKLAFDLKAIQHTAARAAVIAAAGPGASFKGEVVLGIGEPEEADADNRLAEVVFDGYPGATEEARLTAAVHAILGDVPPELLGRDAGDPAMKAIARRAQAKLPALAAAFKKGLAKGDELALRVPVLRDGQSIDWGWIGVTGWKGDTVAGVVKEESDDESPVEDERGVEVPTSWVSDYLLERRGAMPEGGESMKLVGKSKP